MLMTTIPFIFTLSAQAAMKKAVTFDSGGQTLAAELYLPDDYTEGQRLPAMVVTGAWTTVKEQMPATYAAAMADRGYAALVFDFRGWGESPGDIHFLESPQLKTADIEAAADYLATRPEVDPARIAGLGICASAGYMSDAALHSPNIRSVALVAPWLHDAEIVETTYGGPEAVAGLIQVSRRAKAADAPVILEAASSDNENAVMYQAPYYTEPERGLIPEYDNKFNALSWEPWLTYDAIQTAEKLDKPVLLVHSQAAAIPEGAEKYARQMGQNATLVWLDEVSQFDFYDQTESVRKAVQLADQHFQDTL